MNAWLSPKRILNNNNSATQNTPARLPPDAAPGRQVPGRRHEISTLTVSLPSMIADTPRRLRGAMTIGWHGFRPAVSTMAWYG